MFRPYSYTFEEVRPEIGELMNYLQLPDPDSFLPIKELVEDTFATLAGTQEITGGYTLLTCMGANPGEGHVVCPDGVLQTGRRISGYMMGATEIALFICTAGQTFTELSHRYQQNGDFLEAFVVEAIGSVTVEKAMDRIQFRLEAEMAAAGKQITNRYSPGYCDWALTGQQSLFACIGPHSTGITLSESCLMQPIKSVSGIIGIGPEVKKRPYGCAICTNATCVYKRIKSNNL